MKVNKEQIQKLYIQYVLEHSEPPKSVYQFGQYIAIEERAFYTQYTALPAVERAIWHGFFKIVQEELQQDEVYATYSVREKLLAFYYTLLEILKEHRSFVSLTLPQDKKNYNTTVFQQFRSEFATFMQELLQEGIATQEVEERMFLTKRYIDALWYVTLFTIHYWVKDTSDNFENTDIFIEKSVNVAFDLMGRTFVDSAFDLFKFMLTK